VCVGVFFFFIKSNTYLPLLQVCRCISELCRHRSSYSDSMLSECKARSDIPNPEVESLLVFIMYLVSDFLVHYMTVISSI
jgi:hypothetical protein